MCSFCILILNLCVVSLLISFCNPLFRQFSGEEVEGELTITAYPVFYSGVIQPIFQAPLRRVEHLKGHLALQLSLGSELNLREGEAATGVGGGRGGRRLMLEASLEEALTGRRHNVSALLWLHRTRSYISHQAPMFYNPGLPYTIQVGYIILFMITIL